AGLCHARVRHLPTDGKHADRATDAEPRRRRSTVPRSRSPRSRPLGRAHHWLATGVSRRRGRAGALVLDRPPSARPPPKPPPAANRAEAALQGSAAMVPFTGAIKAWIVYPRLTRPRAHKGNFPHCLTQAWRWPTQPRGD